MGSVLRPRALRWCVRGPPCVPPHRAAASPVHDLPCDRSGTGEGSSSTRRRLAGHAAAGVLLSMKRSCLGVDGGAPGVVAGAQQELAALCLHQCSRLGVHIRGPSACLCHVAVRDRFAGLSSSVLCWSGFERSDTVRKLLGMIICVLVTPSNTSLVPTAITGPRAPTRGARSAAHFYLGLV